MKTKVIISGMSFYLLLPLLAVITIIAVVLQLMAWKFGWL